MSFSEKPKSGEPWDIVIIGSGPASFTAAIYTTRGAASTLMVGGEKWGGQLMLTTEVDNYPGLPRMQGPELMQKMRDHSLLFGGELVEKYATKLSKADGGFVVSTSENEYKAKSVIIATGAETKWLEVPGEDKLRGRGVSSCAPCDAPFFKNKKVIVVGGGDSAMEEALVLTKYASKVIIVHRRDSFKASEAMQKRVREVDSQKLEIVWDTEVTELIGENKLEKIILNTKKESSHLKTIRDIQVPQNSGTITSLEPHDNGLLWEMPADGVFVAIGHDPTTSIFKDVIEVDEKGYIVKHQKEGYSMATSVDGIFVAGDVHDSHYKQAITSAGFGCMAGMDALKYLETLKS